MDQEEKRFFDRNCAKACFGVVLSAGSAHLASTGAQTKNRFSSVLPVKIKNAEAEENP